MDKSIQPFAPSSAEAVHDRIWQELTRSAVATAAPASSPHHQSRYSWAKYQEDPSGYGVAGGGS